MKRHGSGLRVAFAATLTGLTLPFTFGPSFVAAQGNTGHSAHTNANSNVKVVAQTSPAPADSSAPAASAAPAAAASDALPGAVASAMAVPAPPVVPPVAAPTDSAPAAPAPAAPAAAPSLPPADFGAPPSGEVPILFNDHHVYIKPDHLMQGRVLGAIVRGGTVLVPMRSMFEQMGASVSFDPATKTVDVTKPGSDVKVQVGKPEVVVNGESRPLDVSPEMYRGSVVVPLRVLSEGMGAYVQWVPEKRTVVVRYLMAVVPTAPPTEAPTETPTAAPAASPPAAIPTVPPVKKRSPYERFIMGDYVFQPKVYNELSPGNKGYESFRINGAIEFTVLNMPWMVEGDYRHFRYAHNQTRPTADQTGCNPTPANEQGCVTQIGPPGSPETFVPYFSARDSDFQTHFGLKIADPRIYVGIGYVWRSNNYVYPIQRGLGFGIGKLADMDARFSVYGSAYYYPQISGDFIDPGSGVHEKLQYRLLSYDVGATFRLLKSPFFLDAGFYGDKLFDKQNAPSDITETGFYAGFGLNF